MNNLSWQTITNPTDAPTTPGVYQYLAGHEIIYIGKSVNLRARLKSHAQSARHDSHEKLIQDNHTKIRWTPTDSDFLATLLEAKLISQHLPKYNRILRDNKSYLYIVINLADKYPKPRLLRARELLTIPERQSKIFGPFASRKIAEEILRTIRRLIPFCQQKGIGKRACFYHHLGLCNPCPSQIEKLTIPDRQSASLTYRNQIKQIIKILSGNLAPVLKSLNKKIQAASDQQDYEQALTIRNRLRVFQQTLTYHQFFDGRITTYSHADQGLIELRKTLSPYLPTLDKLTRIEGYDASTFQLHHSTVSMVVMTDGQLDKSEYKRFKIKNPRSNSDFTMLKEALSRRLKHKNWPHPDLLLIDGGRPQLRMLQPLLDQLENPPLMIGIAKHPDHLVIPLHEGSTLTYHTQHLSSNSPALHLLQLLRDEAHRFSNQYRKLLEKKSKQL